MELFCSHELEAGFHFCLHRVTFQILGTSLTCSSVLTLIRTRAPSTMVVPAKALSFGFVDHNRSTTSSQYWSEAGAPTSRGLLLVLLRPSVLVLPLDSGSDLRQRGFVRRRIQLACQVHERLVQGVPVQG